MKDKLVVSPPLTRVDEVSAADRARLEPLLQQLVQMLSQQQQPVIHIGGDVSHSIIVTGSNNEIHLARSDVDSLSALQHVPSSTPFDRERVYLVRSMIERHARWEREYVPLAGNLLDAPLRLCDRGDQKLSAAGAALDDVRKALVDFRKPHLVILGEPGAGKTTALYRLAFDLARDRLRDPTAHKFPFYVALFKFTGPDRQPSDFLKAEWENSGLAETYVEAVARGEVCFLLDGLNQMPFADRALRIDRWAHWVNEELLPGNWAVFTCRTADYVTDLDLPEVRVQSLDRDRMQQYFQLRFGPDRAATLWRNFETRLQAGDDRFERLARNPFMLSLLAARCEAGQLLTGSRAALMDDLAKALIERELRGGHQIDALAADPQRVLKAEMAVLSRLAFAAQAQAEGTGFTRALVTQAGWGEDDPPALTVEQGLDLALDATLLEVIESHGEAALYAFYHHLLQEYFAARELLRRFRSGQRLSRYWRVPWRKWESPREWLARDRSLKPAPVTGWEETVILAAGLAGEDAPRFIAEVCSSNLPLAGHCLAEAGVDRIDLQPLTDQTRKALLVRQRSSAAQLRARIEAGLAMGDVGQPELLPQLFEFEGHEVRASLPPSHPVPAGPFMRGSDRALQSEFLDEVTTERSVTTSAFRIGRYPVTNAEYRLFIDDGGYRTDRWWSEAGRRWKQGGADAHGEAIRDWLEYRLRYREADLGQIAFERNWPAATFELWREAVQLADEQARELARQLFDRPFDRPAFWDDAEFNRLAKPVVGVNWFEAQAYCRWLSAVTGQGYRLPTEMEWEKAARGATGQEYPWGNQFDAKRCNTTESGIGTTTPVGLFPSGVSPYGLYDVSGNVWEWTADPYRLYSGGLAEAESQFAANYTAARGGSWGHGQRYARCACRAGNTPDNFDVSVGFRVASDISALTE